MELADFIKARLEEDEALAREAPHGPWHIGNAVDPTQPCNVHTFPDVRLVADGLNWLVAEHITQHHPARVLADVEAKRRIVAEHAPHERFKWECRTCGCAESCGCASGQDYPCTTLRLLAVPYASHRDYQEKWRP